MARKHKCDICKLPATISLINGFFIHSYCASCADKIAVLIGR